MASVDKEVTVGTDWTASVAYKYTAGTGYTQVTLATQLTSVDAYYLKTSGGGGVGINYSPSAPGVVTKSLGAGWNTLSCAGETDAYTLLRQLRHVQIGQQQGVGITNFVGQGSYNQFTGSISLSAEVIPLEAGIAMWGLVGNWEGSPVCLFPFDDVRDVSPFDGYWVYMNAAKVFGVIPD